MAGGLDRDLFVRRKRDVGMTAEQARQDAFIVTAQNRRLYSYERREGQSAGVGRGCCQGALACQ
jgi:hypothetical protein